ncbi:MAG TPA: ATP-binding protein [Candidatus Polarisedimenticolaceae bacterium]
MPSNRTAWRTGILIVAIAAIGVAHYVTPVQHFLLHNVWQRAYYIPVLLACAWFGLKGGLLVATACAATYAPHILLHWGHSQPYQANQVLELGMFGVVAVVAGALSDRERRSRDELLRADRLAALGTLAAGMAHEVKNPLGAIAGAAEILEQDYPAGHPRREFLDILREEIGRLTTITGKYLGYARSPEPEVAPLDVNGAVETAVALVGKSAAGKSVTIETTLDRSLPKALADAGQIHQALVNLVLNGMQVMPSGGVLTLETGRDGNDVEIRVRDRGPGIPKGDEDRIFEPFYTTRPGGTGLGLAMSRRIAAAHRGSLSAENAPGGGAIFRLRLPAATRAE